MLTRRRCCCTPVGICPLCAMETLSPLVISGVFSSGYTFSLTSGARSLAGGVYSWLAIGGATPPTTPTILDWSTRVQCSGSPAFTSWNATFRTTGFPTSSNYSINPITSGMVVSCTPLLIQWTGSLAPTGSNPLGNLTSLTISE